MSDEGINQHAVPLEKFQQVLKDAFEKEIITGEPSTPEALAAALVPEAPALETVNLEELAKAARPARPNPHQLWDGMIAQARTKATDKAIKRGDSPIVDLLPGYTMLLGEDTKGRPVVPALRGRYVRYAFDRNGFLSIGKGKGRLKPHWNKTKLQLKDTALGVFRKNLLAYEMEMRKEDAIDGKAFQGLTDEEIMPIAIRSTKNVGRVLKQRRKARREAARLRQEVSRRINRGLIPGNSDRRAHAAG